MLILLVAVAAGVLIGLATGGRLSGLGDFRLRMWPLLLGAVAVELVVGDLPSGPRWVLGLAACVVAGIWCMVNRPVGRRVAGPELIGVGAALNAVVMAADSGMPVSRSALVQAHLGGIPDVTRGHLYKHVAMTGHTALRPLGDVIPVSPLRTVVSVGDVLMLAGIVVTVAVATRTHRSEPNAPAGTEPADRQLLPRQELAKGT
ncbi:MAG TPA: DUF5317 family protein [Acidimicrobiales bacterium]|jgi:hypothetical protein|nr:DUF5317 family protein [Acidimicrobiales bacterium]